MAEIDLADVETMGPAMLSCSERERKFAYALGSGAAETYAQAAVWAGYSTTGDGHRVRASELMDRQRVREVASQCLETMAGLAMRVLRETLTDKRHPERFKAATTILSRLGWGERQALDIGINAKVTISHEEAALQDLQHCLDMGFTRGQLESVFGFSGLDRLLDKLKTAPPKLITYEPQSAPAVPSAVETQKRD